MTFAQHLFGAFKGRARGGTPLCVSKQTGGEQFLLPSGYEP